MRNKLVKGISFLFPIITFYLFELYTHNPFTTMKVPIQLLNIFFFEVLAFFLYFLTGRMKLAIHLETAFFGIIGLANYYVIDFRSAPIMPWDIFSLRTAASVANNYKYTVKKETVFVVLAFVLLFILESIFYRKVKHQVLSFSKKTWYVRATGILVFFFILYGFTGMLHKDSTISKFGMYDKLFTPTVMSKRDGTAVAFLMELKYVTVDKPNKYSTETAEELLGFYEEKEADNTDTQKPNIIVIMNEAFSDPAVLGPFETNEDYMPFVHNILAGDVDNTISGYLNVSVLGGNTANTEFEFLTGNTMAFLPQGSVAYQQYVKKELPSLASHLSNLGYETIAMHPYNSTGWNRNTVYPLLGFEKMYFISDWKNPEKIRKYVSDQSCYDKIISLYEEKDANTPFFVFNVTMQNHSSYTEEFDNFHPNIELTDANSQVLNNYLSLIQLSDTAIENLVTYFSQADEPTMIVFFGDHQPTNSVVKAVWKLNGKSSDSLSDDDEALRYKVPFFIWTNYDITSETQVETSANYLSTKVLHTASLPLTAYTNYLDELQQHYPVLTNIRAVDSNGESTPVKNVQKEINDYAILQYYQLFGRK